MPGTAPASGVVVKVVGIVEHNPARGLPVVNGVVLASDAATGRLAANMDDTSNTTQRTAAASAVAVAALATDNAAELAVIGSGVQAVADVHAMARVRPLRFVRLWSPKPRHGHETASRLDAPLEAAVVAVGSAAGAVKGAAIVATCTHSATVVVAAPGERLLPVVWNANAYATPRTMRLLRGVVDVWLLDMKHGIQACATGLGAGPGAVCVGRRCVRTALAAGPAGLERADVIVRVLVLPGHVECCARPILRWLARWAPAARVNLMHGQYRPAWRATSPDGTTDPRWPELARPWTRR